MHDCERRVERILERDLAGWTGLPTGCREEDLARRLPFR